MASDRETRPSVDTYRSPETSPSVTPSAASLDPADKPCLSAWLWVPSLYFAEGLPYVMVMTVSVIMYKNLGVSNDKIALYTSLLYLPWVIKPLWSPLIDVLSTQRVWVVGTQLTLAAAFMGVAWQVETDGFFTRTLALLWLMAICSATHDIAADGFYMAGLNESSQAWFVGIRSTFYRASMIAGQGGLVMLAGRLEGQLGRGPAWRWSLTVLGLTFLIMSAYHALVLPKPRPQPREHSAELWRGLSESVTSFFQKPGIVRIIAYLLLYRFAEAQLTKIASPFLMDGVSAGGLGLSTEAVGRLYGVYGVTLLLAGGVLGGMAGAKFGVRRCLLPMAAAINLPNVVYVLLALLQPTSQLSIAAAVALEQFGYGFGFAGYLLAMLHVSRGQHQTAHYALCTGLMALGMMIPGMFSGDLQIWLGYPSFFVWVLVATLPSFVVTMLLRNRLRD